MTTHPAIHCPECGAITRRGTQNDGTMVLICTNGDCPRVIVDIQPRSSVVEVEPLSRKENEG